MCVSVRALYLFVCACVRVCAVCALVHACLSCACVVSACACGVRYMWQWVHLQKRGGFGCVQLQRVQHAVQLQGQEINHLLHVTALTQQLCALHDLCGCNVSLQGNLLEFSVWNKLRFVSCSFRFALFGFYFFSAPLSSPHMQTAVQSGDHSPDVVLQCFPIFQKPQASTYSNLAQMDNVVAFVSKDEEAFKHARMYGAFLGGGNKHPTHFYCIILQCSFFVCLEFVPMSKAEVTRATKEITESVSASWLIKEKQWKNNQCMFTQTRNHSEAKHR